MLYVSEVDGQLDGDYPNLCPTRPNAAALGSTADYHRSLLDQQQDSTLNCRRTHDFADLQNDCDLLPKSRRSSKWDRNRLTAQTNASKLRHPELTQEDLEEFESLPLAIRRKYFSTLERLRLAQTSALNASSHKHTRSSNVGCDVNIHRGPRFNQGIYGRGQRPTTSPTYQTHLFPPDALFLAKLPAKIREKHLTREEQLFLAKHLRESVILDAADEAIYRIGRRLTHQVFNPTPPPYRESGVKASKMDRISPSSEKTRDDLYDCFRWLDEDEDLDLSLVLDESQDVPPEEPPVPSVERKPSFRRRLSISRRTFGTRPSYDSIRPVTKDTLSPATSDLSTFPSYPQHARRRSRAFSLMSPKHTTHDSGLSIDPAAAHYQDPEARLKLRVYLSSPQKFDEAIEFGFPSHDAFSPDSDHEYPRRVRSSPHETPSEDEENLKTFLADDQSSTCSENLSMSDPESPKTPLTYDNTPLKPLPHVIRDDMQLKEGYAQVPVASREMTLRMTLTRPDLRACEEQIYGWPKDAYQPPTKLPQSSPFRDDLSPVPHMRARPKESMDKIFADIDQDLELQSANANVMKRLWKRVRGG